MGEKITIFNQGHYTMGFYPPLWGPYVWATLHIFSLNYPVQPTPDDRLAAQQFLTSLVRLLPCPGCRIHYARLLVDMPPELDGKATFYDWGRRAHNAVNLRLKERDPTKREWTKEEFDQHYLKMLLDPAHAREVMDRAARIQHLERELGTSQTLRQQWVDQQLAERFEHQRQLKHREDALARNTRVYIIVLVVLSVLTVGLVVGMYRWGRGRRARGGGDDASRDDETVEEEVEESREESSSLESI